MLLSEEQKKDLVNKIIAHALTLLKDLGVGQEDPETGFTHLELRTREFVLVQHQRQKIKGGRIRTNGLDIWQIEGRSARKLLSVNYIPFEIRFFDKAGKAEWVTQFLELSP